MKIGDAPEIPHLAIVKRRRVLPDDFINYSQIVRHIVLNNWRTVAVAWFSCANDSEKWPISSSSFAGESPKHFIRVRLLLEHRIL